MRRLLWIFFLGACALNAPAPEEPTSLFASPAPLPEVADLLGGCENSETLGYASLLSLLPPWDEERPETMLRLAAVLEEVGEERCLRSARLLYGEVASAYPQHRDVLRAILGFGTLSLRLFQAGPKEMDALLAPYPNREAVLLGAALLAPEDVALPFLKVYGGEKAEQLINVYIQEQRRKGNP